MHTTCYELVVFMYWTCNKSMNNLLSYCGLFDARIRASNKDLPVKSIYSESAMKFEKKITRSDLTQKTSTCDVAKSYGDWEKLNNFWDYVTFTFCFPTDFVTFHCLCDIVGECLDTYVTHAGRAAASRACLTSHCIMVRL